MSRDGDRQGLWQQMQLGVHCDSSQQGNGGRVEPQPSPRAGVREGQEPFPWGKVKGLSLLSSPSRQSWGEAAGEPPTTASPGRGTEP